MGKKGRTGTRAAEGCNAVRINIAGASA